MEEKTIITYGFVTRLSLDELFELRSHIKEKKIPIVFDKVSSRRIYLVEANPSGNTYDNN